MKDLSESNIRRARKLVLESGSDMLHALGCLRCGMREEAHFILALLGWDEESFMVEYFTHLMGGRRG
jgi:hypothetical protein